MQNRTEPVQFGSGPAQAAEACWQDLAGRLLCGEFLERGLDPANAFSGELFAFFRKNPESALTLRDAAAAARRSPDYYGRVCRRKTGFHYHELAALARMASARAMLLQTDETVTAISARLHYSSADYFSRVFRQHTGMTPGQYRRIARQNPDLSAPWSIQPASDGASGT